MFLIDCGAIHRCLFFDSSNLNDIRVTFFFFFGSTALCVCDVENDLAHKKRECSNILLFSSSSAFLFGLQENAFLKLNS